MPRDLGCVIAMSEELGLSLMRFHVFLFAGMVYLGVIHDCTGNLACFL
jgi:hypothetical protein